jgi:SAM-dependent methyltransferase
MGGHTHQPTEQKSTEMFEPPNWDERYSGEKKIWSGNPNAQLVAEVSALTVGTALDVGCGEGGDVIWLASRGWKVTGADFSSNGLARAARHADEAGVGTGGHLLVVGHAPSAVFTHLTASQRRAMFFAQDLVPGLPDGFEVLVVDQRPRTVTHDGATVDVHDSTLLARRLPAA